MEIQDEHWFKSYWRPAAAYVYLIVVLFDFMIAPMFLGYYSYITGNPYIQWKPLTLEGASMFHLSFMAILSVTAWKRGEEKIETIKATVGK